MKNLFSALAPSRRILPWLLVLVLAFSLIHSTNRVEAPTTAVSQRDQDTESEEVSEPVTDAAWLQFADATMGITFEYPSSWTISSLDASPIIDDRSGLLTNVSPTVVTDSELSPYTTGFNVFYHADINTDEFRGGGWEGMKERYASIDELISDPHSTRQKVNEFTLGSRTAYGTTLSGMISMYAVVVEFNGRVYELVFPGAADHLDLTTEEQWILRSFHFYLDEEQPWAFWGDQTLGFEIQYPSYWPVTQGEVGEMRFGVAPWEPAAGVFTVAREQDGQTPFSTEGCEDPVSVFVWEYASTLLRCMDNFSGATFRTYLVSVGSSAYRLSYYEDEIHKPFFEQMLGSFRIHEAP